jgi:hypothetical protein
LAENCQLSIPSGKLCYFTFSMEEKFRMDKTAFAATNTKDADNHLRYWKDKTFTERLDAAWFLIIHAYHIDENTRMDKTVFSKRRR